jgi:hypothetical protein
MKKVYIVFLVLICLVMVVPVFSSNSAFAFYWNGEMLSSNVEFIGNEIYVPVHAFEDAGYSVMLESDKVNIVPKEFKEINEVRLESGDFYSGQAENGIPSGQGELISTSNVYYKGTFEGGELTGQSLIVYPNGDVYKGGVENGLAHGVGEMFYNDGSHYIGSFSKGAKQGVGKQSFENGSEYYGEWDTGLWSGVGKYTDKSGKKLYAKWQDNRQTGRASREEFDQMVIERKAY